MTLEDLDALTESTSSVDMTEQTVVVDVEAMFASYVRRQVRELERDMRIED